MSIDIREAFDRIRWRVEGCIIGGWLHPLWVDSPSYPLRWFPLPRAMRLTLRVLYLDDLARHTPAIQTPNSKVVSTTTLVDE